MKNKLLIFFVIFILLISIFTSSFCSSTNNVHTIETRFGDLKMSEACFSHTYKLAILVKDNGDNASVQFIVSDSPIIIDIVSTSSDTYNEIKYSSSSGMNSGMSIVPRDTFDLEPVDTFVSSSFAFRYSGMPECLYSSFDVYNSEGELVFLGAPLKNLEAVELMRTKQVEQIPHQVEEVVAIVLPILMMIVGVLLILYLVRYKIFLHL